VFKVGDEVLWHGHDDPLERTVVRTISQIDNGKLSFNDYQYTVVKSRSTPWDKYFSYATPAKDLKEYM
jgi:hypothetical protein